MLPRIETGDDAGEPCYAFALAESAIAGGEPHRGRAVATVLRAACTAHAVVTAGLVVGAMLLAVLFLNEGWRTLGFAAHTPFVMAALGGVIGGGVIAARARQRYASRVVSGLLRKGRCGSCGYAMHRPPACEPLDRVRCSECGAQWLAERILPDQAATSRRVIVIGRESPGCDRPVTRDADA
ncbi:MAG: hypothetical protein AAFX79_13075 [Planctomycetota bacterium]